MKASYLRPQWPAAPGVCAAFTLRGGGVSRGRYEGFNLGAHVGDDPDAVARNRAELRRALALPREPLWLEQVHGTQVIDAAHFACPGPAPRADAAVSLGIGAVLAVLVADCLPVLLAARDGTAVAVAHAGWRGLSAGVLEATIAALGRCGALQAWLGPCIGPEHFEVGEEVLEAFTAHEPAAAAAFARNARGRWQCDLQQLARARLDALGIEAVYADRSCSFAEPQRFYSYRRDGATGRMAALIWRAPRDEERT